MENNYISNIKKNNNKLEFTVSNLNRALVNALRRIIISEIPTIAFQTCQSEESDVKIIKNTSALHNEFILHRIGLIPVHLNVTETFDKNKIGRAHV